MEENIFVVIVGKLLEQQKNSNVILKIALKLMVKKLLRCLRRVNISNSKTMKKIKEAFMIYADFESTLVPESQIQMSLILTSTKNMLLVVVVIN